MPLVEWDGIDKKLKLKKQCVWIKMEEMEQQEARTY